MSDGVFVVESLSDLIELSQTAEPHMHAREPPPSRRTGTTRRVIRGYTFWDGSNCSTAGRARAVVSSGARPQAGAGPGTEGAVIGRAPGWRRGRDSRREVGWDTWDGSQSR